MCMLETHFYCYRKNLRKFLFFNIFSVLFKISYTQSHYRHFTDEMTYLFMFSLCFHSLALKGRLVRSRCFVDLCLDDILRFHIII